MGDVSLNPSDALTRRVSSWVSGSVAVLSPIFAIAVVFGWINLEASLVVAVLAGSCILLCALFLAALRLRGALRRVNDAGS